MTSKRRTSIRYVQLVRGSLDGNVSFLLAPQGPMSLYMCVLEKRVVYGVCRLSLYRSVLDHVVVN